MSEIKTIRYKTSVVLLPGGEYTRAELKRILSLMDETDEAAEKAIKPICNYPHCAGGQNGAFCRASCLDTCSPSF